jgi:hypothetical protein
MRINYSDMPSSDTQFQGKGVGTKHSEAPIAVRFSSRVRALLKAMPNAQDYIRQAVEEKLGQTGLPSVAIESKSQLPKVSCVYMAIDPHGVVQYIGRSANLHQRWAGHHKHEELSKMEGIKIAYLAADDVNLLPAVEMALIEWFNPPLNQGLGGGRSLKYGERKRREVLVSEEGWQGSLTLMRSLGCGSVSEFLEEFRNHPEWISVGQLSLSGVEDAVARILPTVPIKDRAIANRFAKKLLAQLGECASSNPD